MIKPNWDVFKAKFSENPQENFEWFCYILFCKEFNKHFGVSRYKNQSSIETDPVEKDGEIVGWQAKFYDTPLSKHSKKLINTVQKAKRDYPDITKIIFYTNKEWGQTNKGTKPKGEVDLENTAKELNIKLVWRATSFFETEFVSVDNKTVSKYFFSFDKTILDIIEEQQKHTKNILDAIQTQIFFGNENIEIDRHDVLEKLEKEEKQVLILSGVGGVGKTAVIKKLYEKLEDKASFYVFKATEFELRNINDLFTGFSFGDFLEGHKDEKNKIIVIDSAEKLLDLNNPDPTKEILSVLIQNNWKIIFTTRDSYLDTLNYQFFEIYKIAPSHVRIRKLDLNELNIFSNNYNFSLPKDERLLEFIRIPFHLNKYLRFYKEDNELDYVAFRETLWNRNIKKSKPAREQCFLKIAFERANKGYFFLNPNCEAKILDAELIGDGVLGYEPPHGYFITHDIYEEWALEKIIETEFLRRGNNQKFFEEIGYSLPIRRSFRKWVSEKLLLKDETIKGFIEEIIEDEKIEPFWKDEVIISVLLSDYSESFFEFFKEELLAKVPALLKKTTFLLRIACKEVDDDFFIQLGLKSSNLSSLKHVFTKPKGHGWRSLIKFVFDNFDEIGTENITFILPIIHDWSSKFKKGNTTRFSGVIALQYYQQIEEKDIYFPQGDDTKDKVLQTIIYSVFEIKDVLEKVFEKILIKKWNSDRDPYYDLIVVVLTKLEGVRVSEVLPEKVLLLADLFWFHIADKDDYSLPSTMKEVEHRYCVSESYNFKYFPESAYQTPIYWLLKYSFRETIGFILRFANKITQCLVENVGEDKFHKSKLYLKNENIEQYSNGDLWGAYRGGGNAPDLFKSIHMALEKFFLEIGESIDGKVLENWLFYLLRNSQSVSISAVVTSIVLAYPDKTFNVAEVLFKTKDFFFYETNRSVFEYAQKSTLLMFKNDFGGNGKNEVYENERLKACDDEHRKWTLEHLFLNYQVFRNEKISEKDVEKRQKDLWEMLDNFYEELPNASKETEADKTWRLYLSRMDGRKMNPTVEETKNGLLVNWNPEVEPKLKEYSEKVLQETFEPMKHSSLMLWASNKLRNDDAYKQYKQYEKDPKLALKETKEILLSEQSKEDIFYSFGSAVPPQVCSVLIRDYLEILSQDEKEFCKSIILDTASSFLRENYEYQIFDGVESSVFVLPILLQEFPEEKEVIKKVLFLALFDEKRIGHYAQFSDYSIKAILSNLWKIKFEDAQAILFGYLLLKPRYEELRKRLRKENYKKGIHTLHEYQIIKKFSVENKVDVGRVIKNNLFINDLNKIKKLDLHILRTAFKIIPLKTKNKEQKKIVKEIVSTFSEGLLSSDSDDRIDYDVKHDFIEKSAWFLLSSPREEIQDYLQPFLDKFNRSELFADLLQGFISAEDYLDSYENFWEVWGLFEGKVVKLCKGGNKHWNIDNIVKSYLFAKNPWKESVTEWHTLKSENKRFFKKITEEIGHCPSVLYAISKLLNDVGSLYLNDGISWISYMLGNNKNLVSDKLETNTIYYLENLVKKYIYENREKIRRTKKLKQNVLIILDFLTEKGSVVGYLLRENIL